jgi:tetratricopeptide (TPR) repeat protein
VHAPHQLWPSRWRYVLGLLFFILGMLSKPTAVVIPLMAATIGIFLLNRPIKKTILELTLWFALMIPCLIWTKLVQPARWDSGLPLWTRPIVAADAVAFYLYKLVWPIHLCIDYSHTPQVIVANHLIYFSWILPAAVVGLLWWKSARYRPAIAAGLLFLMPLLPVLGFVGFEFQQISTTSDHYLYLPMLGAAVLATWWLATNPSSKKILVATGILIALSTRSILQEPSWQDTRSLFYHALAVNPTSVVSTDGLGFLTGREARAIPDPVKARPLFDQSIAWYEQSLRVAPTSVPSIYNLALNYKAIGQIDHGRQLMHRIVELQPQLPEGLRVEPITLAHRLYDFPDIPETISWLDDVIRRDPHNVKVIVLREEAIGKLKDRRD